MNLGKGFFPAYGFVINRVALTTNEADWGIVLLVEKSCWNYELSSFVKTSEEALGYEL